MATVDTFRTDSLVVSILGSLLAEYKQFMRDINIECEQQGLPPAFYNIDSENYLTQGNDPYYLDKFNLSFASMLPLVAKLGFAIQYKPGTSDSQELGFFDLPISLTHAGLLDALKGTAINLGQIKMEGSLGIEDLVPKANLEIINSLEIDSSMKESVSDFNKITLTKVPSTVKTREAFFITGNVTKELIGNSINLIIDNQFQAASGQVSDDGTWQLSFVFLSPGDRLLKIKIGDETVTTRVQVLEVDPGVRVTQIPAKIKALEPFTIRGEADNLDDDEEILIRIDGQYNVAKPVVREGKWEAQVVLSQTGQRLLEVLASEQELIQMNIDVGDIPVGPESFNVIARQVWGAPPTPSNLTNLNAKRITIHHTVTSTLPANASQQVEFNRMRVLRNSHLQRNFRDIGYHYVIMPSGRVYEGRYDLKKGAHDNINDGFGIAFDGSYHIAGSMITEAQFKSAVALCTQLCKRIGIRDPRTLVATPTRFRGNPTKQLPYIVGHRDREPNDCPGMPYGTSVRLEELRQAVSIALA